MRINIELKKMASSKLILLTFGLLFAVANAASFLSFPYTVRFEPETKNFTPFWANMTVEMNFGDHVEVMKTNYDVEINQYSVGWSNGGRHTIVVDRVKNITFSFSSNSSPQAKLPVKLIVLSQPLFRNNIQKHFELEAPSWLEQKTVYVGKAVKF